MVQKYNFNHKITLSLSHESTHRGFFHVLFMPVGHFSKRDLLCAFGHHASFCTALTFQAFSSPQVTIAAVFAPEFEGRDSFELMYSQNGCLDLRIPTGLCPPRAYGLRMIVDHQARDNISRCIVPGRFFTCE